MLPSRTGRLSAVGSLPRRGAGAGELPKKHYTGQGHSRGVLERGRLEKVRPRNWKSGVPWFSSPGADPGTTRAGSQRPQRGQSRGHCSAASQERVTVASAFGCSPQYFFFVVEPGREPPGRLRSRRTASSLLSDYSAWPLGKRPLPRDAARNRPDGCQRYSTRHSHPTLEVST